ncbi:Serine/threonine protein kinase PrkC, regulator of stationary phase [Labilithrix luteola]|uniref:Serine/threonine protein kinase PrkC, regulator of stationary phase n=1 Tax=Labilithrix luteola TaxID=1391654 RepID=A0A0K1PUG2_9BACT|nr:serine/threonine-protein kinase [Labilithrix luteola]AKU96754.1 Serine/threonine protein kinase PrkC, regulator of stationary phase [Labilithrix luteola]
MTPITLPSPYPAPGEVIDGKYQIERILGEGGMGCVARAYHMLLRAPVALKFMNPQFMTFPGAVERFINEGIASKKIRSDHVVPVDDVGKLPSGAPYLVMPCLEGMDLADQLARDGEPGLPVPRAVHFTLQILRGLQAAHANGIIHRDMKPSNCFVVKHDGERDFVKILDFGISKVVQPGSASLTQTNSALGTPLYMSPEQARSPRDVDSRSDLYSVGVILYELLTGRTPFFSDSGEFTEILFKLFTADAPPIKESRPDLDDALAAAVHKALTRDPKDRFATALEMAEAIAPFADDRSGQVVTRMRGFTPEHVLSIPPPADMPLLPSLVAFSKLDARPATDVMADRPTTDVVQGPAVTELLPVKIPGAPGIPQVTQILEQQQQAAADRSSSIPAATPETRARPEDAGARTQLAVAKTQALPVAPAAHARVAIPGAQTDLGASTDIAPEAPEASPEPPSKRSPMTFAMLGLGLMAVLGTGLLVASQTSKTKASHPTDVPTASETLPVATAPSATVSAPAVTASASAAQPAASEAPAASASAPAASASAKTKTPSKPANGPRAPGPVDALDIGIHH